MSFKIGSLRCMKYIDKKPTKYQPLPFFWVGGQRYVPNFEKGPKNNECVRVCGFGAGRGVLTDICLGGAYCVSCQKRL